MSQQGCVGSGNKLQRQKKDPWSFREKKARVMNGVEGRKGEEGKGKVLLRECSGKRGRRRGHSPKRDSNGVTVF